VPSCSIAEAGSCLGRYQTDGQPFTQQYSARTIREPAGRPLTGRESRRTPDPEGQERRPRAPLGHAGGTPKDPRDRPHGSRNCQRREPCICYRACPGRVPQRRQYSHGWSRLPAPDRGSGEPRAPPPGLAVSGRCLRREAAAPQAAGPRPAPSPPLPVARAAPPLPASRPAAGHLRGPPAPAWRVRAGRRRILARGTLPGPELNRPGPLDVP
jgi:hypothetical protein